MPTPPAHTPPPDPKQVARGRQQAKRQAKRRTRRLRSYAAAAAALCLCVGWVVHAEQEAAESAAWAESYGSKCEACRVIVTSAAWTRAA